MRRLALLLALAPSVALADHSFILPSSTLLSGDGNTVTFDAAGSDYVFFFDHRPLGPETIKVFRPDGTPLDDAKPTRTRFRTIIDLPLDRQGTWKVASTQVSVSGSFTVNGEERRVRGGMPMGPMPGMAPGARPGGEGPRPGGEGGERRPTLVALADVPADAADLHLTETASTAETFVTVGAPTEAVFKPSGRALEMQPVTHPNALAAGETARLRFLIDGRPASGVKVTVVPGGQRYRDDDKAMALTTGADGTVAVKWPAAGMYWLGAEAEDAHPAEKRAQVRRMTYSATLEVMTP